MEMRKKENKPSTETDNPKESSKQKDFSPYKTSDLYLSSFLKARGTILQNIERWDNKVFFIFKDEGNIQDLVKEYLNDASVRVLTFKAALTDLRSIIFNHKKS